MGVPNVLYVSRSALSSGIRKGFDWGELRRQILNLTINTYCITLSSDLSNVFLNSLVWFFFQVNIQFQSFVCLPLPLFRCKMASGCMGDGASMIS